MLAKFRAIAKSPVAAVLFALLALSFIIWQTNGPGGIGGALAGGEIVKAGKHTVDAPAFKRMFDQALEQVQQQSKQPVTAQEALQAGFERQVAERVGDDMAFLELIARTGLVPSDTQVVAEIRKAPAFFDQITGRFDKKAYEQRLQGVGLTSKTFEQSLRDDIAQTHVVAGLVGGLRAPLAATAIEAAYARQGRTFSWFAIPPAAVGGQKPPTDAQLNQFIKDNAAQLKRPELRQLSIVRFSSAALAPSMPIDPAAVQKRFDFEKDSLSQPEKRDLIQITAKDQRSAADLSAKLKAGGDPGALAKAAGAQILPHQAAPKTAIPDRKVADAAFALTSGEVSGPIQGDLGWAVVKVLNVTPGKVATLEEARPRIEAQVKKDAAQDRIFAQAQKYEDARSKGATLAAAAQGVGAAVTPIGPVTAEGTTAQNQPSGLPPKVLAAAFKLPQGGESETVDLGGGEYAAVRVNRVLPAAVPPLNEIRGELTRFVALQDMLKRLQARGEALATAVRGGQPMQAAAASVGSTVGAGASVTRDLGGQTFSRELLQRVFGAKPGEVVVSPDNRLGVIVAKIEQVSAPVAAEIAPQLEAARQQTSRTMLSSIGESVRIAARNQIKPKIDLKRARDAVSGAGAGPAPPPAPAS